MTGEAVLTADPGGRNAVLLRHVADEALIACCGAQVLSWRHRGHDVLWTATNAEYVAGRSVRGGAPVVFPWFGFHPTDENLPQHGFVDTMDWDLAATGPGARAIFTLADTAASREAWPHRFGLELAVTLNERLRIALTVVNRGSMPFSFEEAFHTHYATGDVHTAVARGFEGVPVVEHAAEPEADADPHAPIRFRAETDRVFQQVPDEVTLEAPALGHTVTLRAPHAGSAIVWTPWPKKAATLSQMGPDDWLRFVCLETANCKEGALRLAPGESHEMALELAVQLTQATR